MQVLSFHLCFTQNRYNKNVSFESKIDLNLKSIDLKKPADFPDRHLSKSVKLISKLAEKATRDKFGTNQLNSNLMSCLVQNNKNIKDNADNMKSS